MQHEANAIEGLLDVEAGPGCDEACGTQRDELAAGANREGMIWRLQGDDIYEALVEVELVFVDARPRSAVSTIDQAAVELDESAEALRQVQICAEEIALQEV